MLVKILSDLHVNRINPYTYVDHGEHVCVLAGDIAEGMRGVNWALTNIPKHIQVLYVPGNHEYYGHEYFELTLNYIQHNKSNTHVKVLLNEVVDISGTIFAGSTLWTDFMLYNDPKATLDWASGLNDSRWIRFNNHMLNAGDVISLNKASLEFLDSINADILITHYAPEFSESDQWRGHYLTPGFLTKIPENIHKKFKYHIHGHTHNNFDYITPYGTRVICNPRGYSYENANHNGELVINV
jgi:Icc-related predicted phosphoesterase